MRHLTHRRRVQLRTTEDTMDDKPLDQDIAEVEREGQMLVDRNIRAREELDASNKALDDYETKVQTGADRALNYIRQYRNPSQSNPAPIAPDVAATAPATEPPVFTTVDSLDVNTSTTSGGSVESIPGEFNTEFEAGDEAVAAGDTNTGDTGGSGSGDPAA